MQRPNLILGVPLWITNPNVAGEKRNQSRSIHDTNRSRARRSWTKCPARIGAAQLDLTLRRQFAFTEHLNL